MQQRPDPQRDAAADDRHGAESQRPDDGRTGCAGRHERPRQLYRAAHRAGRHQGAGTAASAALRRGVHHGRAGLGPCGRGDGHRRAGRPPRAGLLGRV